MSGVPTAINSTGPRVLQPRYHCYLETRASIIFFATVQKAFCGARLADLSYNSSDLVRNFEGVGVSTPRHRIGLAPVGVYRLQ